LSLPQPPLNGDRNPEQFVVFRSLEPAQLVVLQSLWLCKTTKPIKSPAKYVNQVCLNTHNQEVKAWGFKQPLAS
jgi:hypothetical protein